MKTHISNIFSKLALTDRTQAALYMHNRGLLERPVPTYRPLAKTARVLAPRTSGNERVRSSGRRRAEAPAIRPIRVGGDDEPHEVAPPLRSPSP